MSQQVATTAREAVLVEDAELIRMMGMPVLEAVPLRNVPYELTDPFILVHEGRFSPSEMAGKDTKHPHRGFDNIWYVLKGSASTGHTTGPRGSIERARLSEGSLLRLRTGRGAWHAEGVGAEEREEGRGDAEFRSVLFWVNLARKDSRERHHILISTPNGSPPSRRNRAAPARSSMLSRSRPAGTSASEPTSTIASSTLTGSSIGTTPCSKGGRRGTSTAPRKLASRPTAG